MRMCKILEKEKKENHNLQYKRFSLAGYRLGGLLALLLFLSLECLGSLLVNGDRFMISLVGALFCSVIIILELLEINKIDEVLGDDKQSKTISQKP